MVLMEGIVEARSKPGKEVVCVLRIKCLNLYCGAKIVKSDNNSQ